VADAEFCCKWAPTVDGVELTAHPFALAMDSNNKNHPDPNATSGAGANGASSVGVSARQLQGRRAAAAVPILLGTNRDEDVSFVGQGGGPLDWNMTADDFGAFAKGLYNFSDAQIKQLQALCTYPVLTDACLLAYCFTVYCLTFHSMRVQAHAHAVVPLPVSTQL
jgi:hypothetical protein